MKSLTTFIEQIQTEITFETSRSSGKGGQHVNKTESRVTLVWNFRNSDFFSEEEKELVVTKCKTFVSGDILRISTEENRSQVKNKKKSIYKLKKLLEVAFYEEKPRKKSRVPYSVREKRIKNKKQLGEIKKTRKKIDKRDF
jgi:ribosome-associated protein